LMFDVVLSNDAYLLLAIAGTIVSIAIPLVLIWRGK
jgi:hypothetical protein